jgi:hypothetical protein
MIGNGAISQGDTSSGFRAQNRIQQTGHSKDQVGTKWSPSPTENQVDNIRYPPFPAVEQNQYTGQSKTQLGTKWSPSLRENQVDTTQVDITLDPSKNQVGTKWSPSPRENQVDNTLDPHSIAVNQNRQEVSTPEVDGLEIRTGPNAASQENIWLNTYGIMNCGAETMRAAWPNLKHVFAIRKTDDTLTKIDDPDLVTIIGPRVREDTLTKHLVDLLVIERGGISKPRYSPIPEDLGGLDTRHHDRNTTKGCSRELGCQFYNLGERSYR